MLGTQTFAENKCTLISDPSALSQTPAYTMRPQTWGPCMFTPQISNEIKSNQQLYQCASYN